MKRRFVVAFLLALGLAAAPLAVRPQTTVAAMQPGLLHENVVPGRYLIWS